MNVAEAKKIFTLLNKATYKHGLPVLAMALAEDGYIQTTNLSYGIRLPWNGEECLVHPAQVLTLTKGQDKKAEVTITKDFIRVGPIQVKNDAAGTELDEYPRQDFSLAQAGDLTAEQVKSLKMAGNFAGYDPGQPILEHVHLFERGIVATDRSAVYWDQFAWEGPAFNIPMTILPLLSGGPVVLRRGGGYGRIVDGTTDILFRLGDGTFPEVWRLIPDDYQHQAIVPAPAVRGVLAPFAGGKHPGIMKVGLNGALTFTPHNAEPIHVDAATRGELTIHFNPANLTRGFLPFGDGEVTWEMRGAEELVRIRQGNVSTVVLPMMGN